MHRVQGQPLALALAVGPSHALRLPQCIFLSYHRDGPQIPYRMGPRVPPHREAPWTATQSAVGETETYLVL